MVLAFASVRDISDRRIPNWTVAAVACLFVAWAFVVPSISFLSSLGAAAIVFAVTAALFAFHVVGAGDSKLMTALALFAGLSRLPLFVVATVLAGGAIALFSLALRPTRVLVMLQMRGKGDFGRGIPYGVAISLGGASILLSELSCNSADHRLVCF